MPSDIQAIPFEVNMRKRKWFMHIQATFYEQSIFPGTAQKMKFSIKDFFSAISCGFGHIY